MTDALLIQKDLVTISAKIQDVGANRWRPGFVGLLAVAPEHRVWHGDARLEVDGVNVGVHLLPSTALRSDGLRPVSFQSDLLPGASIA